MVHSAASSAANLRHGMDGAPSPHSPLGILLVSKDESAERVLFMYPFPSHSDIPFKGKLQYEKDESKSSANSTFDKFDREASAMENRYLQNGNLATENDLSEVESRTIGLPVKMLAPLLCTKGTCNEEGVPFEIKVDNVRFAGFPWRIENCGSLSLAVVFILPGTSDAHIVDAFQRLSRKIAIAINTEQQRCNYLRDQICLMQPAHDEFEALLSDEQQCKSHILYETILAKSGLAKHLRDIFEDVCEYGMVDVFVDDCVEVGFCVEPKVLCHAGLAPRSSAQVEKIMECIRPYHAILFLEDSVPSPDSNPFVRRFLEEYEPSRSIEELAALACLPLSQMLQIVRHYLLWARAIVIYPICTSNVYANAEERLPQGYRKLEAEFNEKFIGYQLTDVLKAFSPPCTLGQLMTDTAIYTGQPSLHMSMLVFLLRNQFLIQLHTYFYLLPPASNTQQQKAAKTSNKIAMNDDIINANGSGSIDEYKCLTNDDLSMNQQQHPYKSSARIRTCVNSSKELNVELKTHILTICSRAMHIIPEPEVFLLASTFVSFIPFLCGKNHVEDIIYRTKLNRSTVMRVLDTFSDLVCPFFCQDLIVDD